MPKKIKFESAIFLFLFHGINSIKKNEKFKKNEKKILKSLKQLEFKKDGRIINIYFKYSSEKIYLMDFSSCNLYIRGDSRKKDGQTKLMEVENKLFFENEFEKFINYNFNI